MSSAGPGLYSCALTADLIPFAQIRAWTRSCVGLASQGRSRQANERTTIRLPVDPIYEVAEFRDSQWLRRVSVAIENGGDS